MQGLADRVASELDDVLKTSSSATLAVPGGTTPGPMFDALSKKELDWPKVKVLLSDERQVPADHPRSNEKLVRQTLFRNRAALANFVRYVPDETAGLSKVNEDMVTCLPIHVLVLGMGADMHTASLFPGSPQLTEALDARAHPVMSIEAPGAPENRITLTGPVLSAAANKHVLITGQDKRAALDRATMLGVAEAPINLVLPDATVHWAP